VSEPVGEVAEKYIVGGDNVTISCSVAYYGPEIPYIEWTDENDATVMTGAKEYNDQCELCKIVNYNNNNNERNSDNVTSVVSELEIFVPDDAEYLPSYNCSVRFKSQHDVPRRLTFYNYKLGAADHYTWYNNRYTPHHWTSPETKVSCK